MPNYLIATSRVPKDLEGFNAICDNIRKAGEEQNLTVGGILLTDGPGCANLAINIEGDEEVAEKLMENIAWAFMPSKWCGTPDPIPEGNTYNLSK